ncbi:MAG: cobalt-precorrin 5A hydrolase [Candidatus Accumulibacter sp.]|jgi:cobalt-precorrin 5A hydrolase|nr:cobalt-precorrin 5A hydrolase [Accumulibacter sp.]
MTRRHAIVTLTRGALALGRRLSARLPGSDLYLNRSFAATAAPNERLIEGSLAELAADLFARYDSLVWIMASGIVVRGIAPLLRNKASDPAVLVIDERGRFVVSLVSGHLGRANDDARKIAALLGAEPVITTASDVTGRLAVDTLAMRLDCAIDDPEAAKRVTAEIVNGARVALSAPWPVDAPLPDNIQPIGARDDPGEYDGLIAISETPPGYRHDNQAWLIPRRVVAGVGCKRGKGAADIVRAIRAAMNDAAIDIRALSRIASVDLKADEAGLIEAAQSLGVPLRFVGRDAIARLDGRYQASDFVRSAIGVAGVCEPAAMLCGGGPLIAGKRAGNGVTVALARRPEESGHGAENHD